MKASETAARKGGPAVKAGIADLFVTPEATVEETIATIDGCGLGVALVVREGGRLLDIVTDGDIRRAILHGIRLRQRLSVVLELKRTVSGKTMLTCPVETPREILCRLMQEQRLRHVPIVDGEGRVIDLATLEMLMPSPDDFVGAVVMAGGEGTRLRPLTENLPKPLLPVGGRPILERTLERFARAGIRRVMVTTHYKAERIIQHFGNGNAHGVDIEYVHEDRPLGTGGALGLLERPSGALLVINGDILTDIDFPALGRYHRDASAHLTVAVRKLEIEIPYGVLRCEGMDVRGIEEKPRVELFVNAGIYVLEPEVFDYVSQNEPLAMTDLIERLVKDGRRVVSFPVREYWLDIGQHADYQRAQEDLRDGRVKT